MAFSTEIFSALDLLYINKDVKWQSLCERGVFRPSKGRGLNNFPGVPLDHHCGSISPST